MMSDDTKPTTGKQKLLIMLILITAGLLVVSLAMNGQLQTTSDTGIDRDTCLQQGNVWDNTKERCYGSSATRFPRSYLANCSPQEEALQLDLISDSKGQIILPDSPSQAYQVSKTDTDGSQSKYESENGEVAVSKSGNVVTVRKGGEVIHKDCGLQKNQPEAPLGTETARLSVNQSGTANGVTITLNNIVADNRCPVDAVCVVSGDLRINTTLRADGVQEQPSLSTAQSAYEFVDRSVAVTGVVPSRVADQEYDENNYLVTFWVTHFE